MKDYDLWDLSVNIIKQILSFQLIKSEKESKYVYF